MNLDETPVGVIRDWTCFEQFRAVSIRKRILVPIFGGLGRHQFFSTQDESQSQTFKLRGVQHASMSHRSRKHTKKLSRHKKNKKIKKSQTVCRGRPTQPAAFSSSTIYIAGGDFPETGSLPRLKTSSMTRTSTLLHTQQHVGFSKYLNNQSTVQVRAVLKF